jgi:VanZ family protein
MILFIGLFIAVSDEFLQLFIEGRSGLVQDVALDFAGFTFGMLVYIALSLISKMTSKNSANNDK